MCTGLEIAAIAGTVASLAGTGTSMAAAANARSDMNRQVEDALAQQQAFQRQATPIARQSIQESGATPAARQITSGAQQAADQYRQLAAIPLSTASSALPVDESLLKGQVQQAREAAAGQQGYSNQALQQWLKDQEVNRQLGVISNLAGSAEANVPALTNLAAQRSAGLYGLGSLLQSGGNLATLYGAVGARRAQTDPFANAPLLDVNTNPAVQGAV